MARNKRRAGKDRAASDGNASARDVTGSPPAGSTGGPPVRTWKSTPRLAVLATIAIVAIGIATFPFLGDFGPSNAPDIAKAAFVGSEACATCHQTEAKLWNESQHKHAMQHANATSVLGDFDNASFDYFDVRSRFFKKDDKFFVETDGPDGRLASFEVKYTFGIEPLQQYLIEFPDGRIQALSIAWDSRPKDQGGQHWFHLYPNEQIKHDDVLHWTKLNQNWNFMCAECHSTGVRRTMTQLITASARHGPKSASAARRATAADRGT